MQNYKINLEVFEGPMDLLLFLIRKNHVDIYDIPVATLLDEYVTYIETLSELDIDIAAEFLLMAAELTHIKSQMLLPNADVKAEDEDSDPRAGLVQRLLEYQKYKEAANELDKRELLVRDVFSPTADLSEEERPVTAEAGALWKAFIKLIEKLPTETQHQIKVEHISVGTRILELLDILQPNKNISWEDVLPRPLTRTTVIVTFLALLEMTKLGFISVHQTEPNKIYIVAGENVNNTNREMFETFDQRAGYGE
jgi:segregation and condensation protein A